MASDNAYQALTEQHAEGDSSRWAFGGMSGDSEASPGQLSDDPLAGVPTELPDGVDAVDLAAYCRHLGDDALVMSQRLTEWVTAAPELEEELALANIALDLLGQARLLLARSGQAEGSGRGEDTLAFLRDAGEFGNVRLVEAPNVDFAQTSARLLVYSSWRLALFTRLDRSRDPVLAAVAAKGARELAYHRDYAARWTIRLGDGTAYSRKRMVAGLAVVWPDVADLFVASPVERRVADAGVGVDPALAREEFEAVIDQVLARARLDRPSWPGGVPNAGRAAHTEHLAPLLAEMQGLARAHPEATW